MKKLGLIFVLAVIAQAALAQKFSVKGIVVDEESNGLPSATVVLQNASDSVMVNFSVTSIDGEFELKGINPGDYRLNITFTGYSPSVHTIKAPESGNVVDLGIIKMEPMSAMLTEIVIMGESIPVRIKGDTIEFNASSFKTSANANVEELLKQLPGVEVSPDGTVTAQGETVQQVLVNGREFFGRDPKMATRGLPADAVEKIQVFDKRSDQAVFSGIDDGQRQKTINLEIKKDALKGTFGNVEAGSNGDDRHTGRLSINRFRDTRMISLQGSGNNVNQQSFSFGGGGGGNSGITTTYTGGLNYSDDFGKKLRLSSNYRYSDTNNEVITLTDRINFIAEGETLDYNDISRRFNQTRSHNADIRMNHEIDSANSGIYEFRASQSSGDRTSTKNSVSEGQFETVTNETIDRTLTESKSLNSSALLRHRFRKPGRTFSTQLTFNISDNSSNGELISTGSQAIQNFTQINRQDTDNRTFGLNVNYTEPLSSNKFLELAYNYRENKSDVVREVFDIEDGESTGLNPNLSATYNTGTISNIPSFSVRFVHDAFNLSIGTSYQNTTIKGELISQDTTINRTYQALTPFVRLNYTFPNSGRLRINYQTDMREPSVSDLQPLLVNSDPLNITVGNPNLRPSYSHQVSANYNSYDIARQINLFINTSATYTLHNIVNAQTFDPVTLVRTTMPINVKDNLSLNANVNFGFQLSKFKSRFTLGPTTTYSERITVVNDKETPSYSQSYGGSISYNYSLDTRVIFDARATLTKSVTRYGAGSTNQDQDTYNQVFASQLNVTFLKNYRIAPNFSYSIYKSQTTDFNRNIPMLNMTISRFVLKQAGELKFGVYNFLDNSSNINQTVTDNYLQTVETTNNLGRYWLVSFAYNIGRNPGGARGGVMMMR